MSRTPRGHAHSGVGDGGSSLKPEHVFLGEQGSAPSDDQIGKGNVAIYAKTDGHLYTKAHGGSETPATGGQTFIQPNIERIERDSDSTGIVASVSTHYFLLNSTTSPIDVDLPDSPKDGAQVAVSNDVDSSEDIFVFPQAPDEINGLDDGFTVVPWGANVFEYSASVGQWWTA